MSELNETLTRRPSPHQVKSEAVGEKMCVLDWLMHTHTPGYTDSADAKYRIPKFISNKRLSPFQCARTHVPGKAGTS